MSNQSEKVEELKPGYYPICDRCPFKDLYILSKNFDLLVQRIQILEKQNKDLSERLKALEESDQD